MSYQQKFMELAVQTADKGIERGCGGPFGCVIVKDGELLAQAHNTVVTTHDPTAHGEINAIRQASQKLANFDLSDCELYTTSEPCPMCLAAIMWARIPQIYCLMHIHDAAQLGFDDTAFYRDVIAYFQTGQAPNLQVSFHHESSGAALFAKYAKMEKVKY